MIAYSFWFICLCSVFGTGILCDKKFEKRQTSCSVDTFKCTNGLCIDYSLACDGHADCSDGSDETQNLCTQLIPSCDSFAFRCKYGACVNKNAKCNGKNDCVDGSDENLPECRSNYHQQSNVSKCQSQNEYSCRNGLCIDDTSICDGVRDCTDGSDETSALCKTFTCLSFSFKCKYGGCINKNYRCDGIKHCIDGSDEEQCHPNLSSRPPSSSPPPTTKIPSKPKPSLSTPPTYSKKSKCVIPTSEGTIYSFNDTNTYTVLPPGTKVDPFRIVEEDCEAGYHKVVPNRFMLCTENGQWKPLISDKLCLKKCPPMTSDSLDIRCTLNGKNVNCSNPSIPDTILRPSCKVMYTLPNGQLETPIELICLSDGKWSGQLYRCIPYCGRLFTPSKELILNGVEAQYGSAPWNVGIYRINHNNNYDLICGGTLISQNLVVSAAHCFWQEGLTNRILINDGQYKIAVGKYKRDFSVVDNEFTQIIDAGLIYLNVDYYGSSGFHAQDIAIIVLPSKVMISNAVLPACIEWTKQHTIPNGSLGKIVGWGKTELMIPSSKLLEGYLPYIDHNTCRNMYKNGFELFVTSDKFCAGSQSSDIDIRFLFGDTLYRKGQGVHEGDSGAGLTYVHDSLSYLTGIVSVKDPNTNDSVAVFTDVSFHTKWIREIYINYTYTSDDASAGANRMTANKNK